MVSRKDYDVLVVGGGPAGLSAALSAAENGARTGIIEREDRLGGILKQCVHDGFGLVRFGEQLAGPEYARRFADRVVEATSKGTVLATHLGAFVHAARRETCGDGGVRYVLECVSRDEGVFVAAARSLVLATGCRERTDRQVFIHGERPAGVFTAGLAQHLVNIEGLLPGHRAVILGSGDIGLIMARRLFLEGVEVEGVYEIKSEPSGLSRNVRQCLEDFGIPLNLSTTVTAVHGDRRVQGVTVASVDRRGTPIPGSERYVECDTLVLSVGLIPENELAVSLGLALDPATRGPRVDQEGRMAEAERADEGIFVCGNALHVNDLVDYVSESGEQAGRAAALFAAARREGVPIPERELIPVKAGSGFLYAVPQFIDRARGGKAVLYFRVNATRAEGGVVRVASGGATVLKKRYAVLRPPEMERLEIDVAAVPEGATQISLELADKGEGDGR